MNDVVCRPLRVDRRNLQTDQADLNAESAELASLRLRTKELTSKIEIRDARIERLAQLVEDIPALKARINDLAFALTASGDREAALERQLADRFSELAVLTSALLQEEEKSEEWQRRANNLLGILRAILSEAPWWWSLMPRRWRRNRLNLRLARLELFDARDYAAKQRDVVAAGHEPLQHYIFHGIDEMRAGTR